MISEWAMIILGGEGWGCPNYFFFENSKPEYFGLSSQIKSRVQNDVDIQTFQEELKLRKDFLLWKFAWPYKDSGEEFI